MGQQTRDAIALVLAELHDDTDAFVHVWERPRTPEESEHLLAVLIALVATMADAMAPAIGPEGLDDFFLRCAEKATLP